MWIYTGAQRRICNTIFLRCGILLKASKLQEINLQKKLKGKGNFKIQLKLNKTNLYQFCRHENLKNKRPHVRLFNNLIFILMRIKERYFICEWAIYYWEELMRYGRGLVGAVFQLKPPCLCVIEDAWLMYSWREYLILSTLSAFT